MTDFLATIILVCAAGFWPIAFVVSALVAIFGDDDPPPKRPSGTVATTRLSATRPTRRSLLSGRIVAPLNHTPCDSALPRDDLTRCEITDNRASVRG
jgi:hypothetical protein